MSNVTLQELSNDVLNIAFLEKSETKRINSRYSEIVKR